MTVLTPVPEIATTGTRGAFHRRPTSFRSYWKTSSTTPTARTECTRFPHRARPYQFETIHPFLDGNGRLGRLLVSSLLQQETPCLEPYLYLSSYFNAHRTSYVDRLLAVSQRGEWEPWLRFFLEGCERRPSVSRDWLDRTAEHRPQSRSSNYGA